MLAALALTLPPTAYVAGALAATNEGPAPRPAIVLSPTPAPTATPTPTPTATPTPAASPTTSSTPPPGPSATPDPDGGRCGDDDDGDGVVVVIPCRETGEDHDSGRGGSHDDHGDRSGHDD